MNSNLLICCSKQCKSQSKIFQSSQIKEHIKQKCDIESFDDFCNKLTEKHSALSHLSEITNYNSHLLNLEQFKDKLIKQFTSLVQNEIQLAKETITNICNQAQIYKTIYTALQNQDLEYITQHHNLLYDDHSKQFQDILSSVANQYKKLKLIEQLIEKNTWSKIEENQTINNGSSEIQFQSENKNDQSQTLLQLKNEEVQQRDLQIKSSIKQYEDKTQTQIEVLTQQQKMQIPTIIQSKEFQNLLNIQQNTLEDCIYGCMFGQVIGDALGAQIEFSKVTPLKVKDALEMTGGGKLSLAPGQITDDSDMALAVLRGLNIGQNKDLYGSLNETDRIVECIALEFYDWLCSYPIDIGITTRKALNVTYKRGFLYSALMREKARIKNSESLSNGSLMRSSSLAVYCALKGKNFNFDMIWQLVQKESSLTHSNECVSATTTLWVFTIQQLILNHKMEVKKRVEKVLRLLKEKYDEIQSQIQNYDLQKIWESYEQRILPDPQVTIGFLAITWIRGLVLLQDLLINPIKDFKNIMEEILNWGGDTDTNACIIGSLFGAILGFNHFINDNDCRMWVNKTLECNEREKYNSQQIILETMKLVKCFN